jgi:hypothetical protein
VAVERRFDEDHVVREVRKLRPHGGEIIAVQPGMF